MVQVYLRSVGMVLGRGWRSAGRCSDCGAQCQLWGPRGCRCSGREQDKSSGLESVKGRRAQSGYRRALTGRSLSLSSFPSEPPHIGGTLLTEASLVRTLLPLPRAPCRSKTEVLKGRGSSWVSSAAASAPWTAPPEKRLLEDATDVMAWHHNSEFLNCSLSSS